MYMQNGTSFNEIVQIRQDNLTNYITWLYGTKNYMGAKSIYHSYAIEFKPLGWNEKPLPTRIY